MAHILVVDDERSICELLEITFRKEGHRVEVALNGEAARRKLESQIFDIVISDIRMPDTTGVELLQFCKEISPSSYFLLITGVPTVDTAIAAINAGADRYVIKDHDLVDQLRRAVRQVDETLRLKSEAGYLRRELRRLTGQDNIIGHSAKMRAIFDMIMTVAPQTSRVLITGETGTGKELVARAIHENSARSKEPFITINCGAFPETLLESELFGYVKGAFTGANENRQGLFRGAHGGTLFLDEIGNMSLPMQVKLFRVLQEGKVRPVGSNEETEIDVRVIAATNKDLDKAIAAGEFREDLFYRLSVIPIPLAAAARTQGRHSAHGQVLSGAVPQDHGKADRGHYAGRHGPAGSLRLARKRARTGKYDGAFRGSGNGKHDFRRRPSRKDSATRDARSSGNFRVRQTAMSIFRRAGIDLEKPVQDLERAYILTALEACDGVGTRAAELLKMTYRSFRHYSKKYNIR